MIAFELFATGPHHSALGRSQSRLGSRGAMALRLQVSLHTPGRIVLPRNYPEKLMAFIYRLLLEEAPGWAAWLHSHGFEGDGKRFKLFTFSRLEGHRARADEAGLGLDGPVRWWISSPVPEFVAAFGARLLQEGRVTVGRQSFPVLAVRREPAPAFAPGQTYRFRTNRCGRGRADQPTG